MENPIGFHKFDILLGSSPLPAFSIITGVVFTLNVDRFDLLDHLKVGFRNIFVGCTRSELRKLESCGLNVRNFYFIVIA